MTEIESLLLECLRRLSNEYDERERQLTRRLDALTRRLEDLTRRLEDLTELQMRK